MIRPRRANPAPTPSGKARGGKPVVQSLNCRSAIFVVLALAFLGYNYLYLRPRHASFGDSLASATRAVATPGSIAARIETLQMSAEEEGRLLVGEDYSDEASAAKADDNAPPREEASQVDEPSFEQQLGETVGADAEQQPVPNGADNEEELQATAAAAAEEAVAEAEAEEAAAESDDVVGGEAFGGTFDGTHFHLDTQIVLPVTPILQHFDNSQNFWPLHSILKQRGWAVATSALPSRVNLWLSKGAVPPRMKRGSQMLNSMGVSGCIGGAKTLQLSCRRRLASFHGCDYDALKIQPPQYNMLDLEDCQRFFTTRDGSDELFLVKPSYTFHGSGIRLLKFKDVRAEYGACKTPKHAIIMDYVSKPATMMGGYKFDFRTYLLVASLNPQLVFYHDGFVRKSDKVYSETARDMNVHITNKITQSRDDHFFNFTTLAWSLHHESGLPRDHVDAYVRPRAQNVSRFLFHTARVQAKPPAHVPGRFHLFGIDWLLDSAGQLHLLEGNGYPLVTHYDGIDLTPRVWEEMTDLILAVQTKPASLGTKLGAGFKFGGWTLVFNELEESYAQSQGRAFNACAVFGA